MFSQASIILSTIRLMPNRSLLILVGHSITCYGAVGTHPTGMLSCLLYVYVNIVMKETSYFIILQMFLPQIFLLPPVYEFLEPQRILDLSSVVLLLGRVNESENDTRSPRLRFFNSFSKVILSIFFKMK